MAEKNANPGFGYRYGKIGLFLKMLQCLADSFGVVFRQIRWCEMRLELSQKEE